MFQVAAFESPDIITNGGVINDLTGALAKKMSSAFLNALSGLSCPQFGQIQRQPAQHLPWVHQVQRQEGYLPVERRSTSTHALRWEEGRAVAVSCGDDGTSSLFTRHSPVTPASRTTLMTIILYLDCFNAGNVHSSVRFACISCATLHCLSPTHLPLTLVIRVAPFHARIVSPPADHGEHIPSQESCTASQVNAPPPAIRYAKYSTA